MTKEEARKAIEESYMFDSDIHLPIFDEVVIRGEFKPGEPLEQWTFRGLIKLAYDLEDKRNE